MRRAALDGLTVVLTRAPEDNAPLAAALRGRMASVIELPCVRTEPLADASDLAAVLAGLTSRDLLVVTSRAGVDAVAGAMPADGVRAQVAAVGESTARRAQSAGIRVTFVATRADGRTLGQELPLPEGSVVLARSDAALPDLPAILRERGARVAEVVAYRTAAGPVDDPAAVLGSLAAGPVVVVLASPSAVDGLRMAVPHSALRRAGLVAIGPATADRIRSRLGATAVVAERPDVTALVRAIE
ncbi:MAG: uroporphyrinogen-III synthase, partial [Chloroflexota bacterium]